jgi:hypothetical protein
MSVRASANTSPAQAPDANAALTQSELLVAEPRSADLTRPVESAIPAGDRRPDPVGVLFIGDPHLASRVPGFRRDDYPRTILGKLRFALGYAREHALVPVLLGDLFDFPRDNANWLLVELHQVLDRPTLAIYGNHDCKENQPTDNDSVSILVASGLLRLLSAERPWTGVVNGCTVVIGGTCWGQKLPTAFDPAPFVPVSPEGGRPSYVLWATHHDLLFPGYEEVARRACKEVPGIDLIVNGHIHRDLGEVIAGGTRWVNPGNITRIARSDASKAHVPGMLRVDVSPAGLTCRRVEVPHEPFDAVFHPEVHSAPVQVEQSLFIRELAKLQSIRTATGVGLREFLDANLPQFGPAVAAEINLLADEVTRHGE